MAGKVKGKGKEKPSYWLSGKQEARRTLPKGRIGRRCSRRFRQEGSKGARTFRGSKPQKRRFSAFQGRPGSKAGGHDPALRSQIAKLQPRQALQSQAGSNRSFQCGPGFCRKTAGKPGKRKGKAWKEKGKGSGKALLVCSVTKGSSAKRKGSAGACSKQKERRRQRRCRSRRRRCSDLAPIEGSAKPESQRGSKKRSRRKKADHGSSERKDAQRGGGINPPPKGKQALSFCKRARGACLLPACSAAPVTDHTRAGFRRALEGKADHKSKR